MFLSETPLTHYRQLTSIGYQKIKAIKGAFEFQIPYVRYRHELDSLEEFVLFIYRAVKFSIIIVKI